MNSPGLAENGLPTLFTEEPWQRAFTDELGATRVERWLPNIGLLVFESAGVGQWRTKKGDLAKKAKRGYVLTDLVGSRRDMVSVTTVLDVLAKPALISWAEDFGARGAIAAQRMGEIPDDLPLDEVIERVRFLALGADAQKKRAAQRGLDVHDALEEWTKTGHLPAVTDLAVEQRPYLEGLDAALADLNPEPIAAEQIVCHPALGYAGRYDLRCRIDGKDTLLDLKTSERGKPYAEAHAQLVGYAMAEEEIGTGFPERLVALGVGADGGFCAVDSCASKDHWLSILRTYRSMAEVRDGMKAA